MTKIEKKFSKIESGTKVEVLEIDPFRHNSPEYKCCLQRIHFKQGAFIIGIILVLAAVLAFIFSTVANYWLGFIPAVLTLVLGALILYAHKSEKQRFYLPFVIVQSILVVAAFLFTITSIIVIILAPKWAQGFVENVESKSFRNETEAVSETRVFFAIAAALLLAFIFLSVWFIWVVHNAYHYMQDMHLARHPHKFLYRNGIKDGLEHQVVVVEPVTPTNGNGLQKY